MLLYSASIPIDPRTKKNHMQIVGSGPRCPVCKKPSRQYVRQSAASSKFAFDAAHFLLNRPPAPIQGPVHLVYRLYMHTRRRVDDLNLYENIDDILVENRILADDSIRVIRCRDGSCVRYDKENPRVEIEIHDLEGVEDFALE